MSCHHPQPLVSRESERQISAALSRSASLYTIATILLVILVLSVQSTNKASASDAATIDVTTELTIAEDSPGWWEIESTLRVSAPADHPAVQRIRLHSIEDDVFRDSVLELVTDLGVFDRERLADAFFWDDLDKRTFRLTNDTATASITNVSHFNYDRPQTVSDSGRTYTLWLVSTEDDAVRFELVDAYPPVRGVWNVVFVADGVVLTAISPVPSTPVEGERLAWRFDSGIPSSPIHIDILTVPADDSSWGLSDTPYWPHIVRFGDVLSLASGLSQLLFIPVIGAVLIQRIATRTHGPLSPHELDIVRIGENFRSLVVLSVICLALPQFLYSTLLAVVGYGGVIDYFYIWYLQLIISVGLALFVFFTWQRKSMRSRLLAALTAALIAVSLGHFKVGFLSVAPSSSQDSWFRTAIAAAAILLASYVITRGALQRLPKLLPRIEEIAPNSASSWKYHALKAVVRVPLIVTLFLLIQIILLPTALFRLQQQLEQTGPESWETWVETWPSVREILPYWLGWAILSLLPFVTLIAVVSILFYSGRTARDVLFANQRMQGLLVLLLFGGFVVGINDYYAGVWLPVSIIVAAPVLKLVLRRDSRLDWEIAHLNRHLPPTESPVPIAYRRSLLRQAQMLHRTRRDRASLYDQFVKGEDLGGAYYARQAELSDTESRIARGSLKPKEMSVGQPIVNLPQRTTAEALALTNGPGCSWWDNGVQAMLIASRLAIVPLAYSVFVILTKDMADFGLLMERPFGLVDAAFLLLWEASFWLTAALVMGCLYAYLPGRHGVFKGLALTGVFAVARGASQVVAVWAGDPWTSNWTFRCFQLLLYLVALGAAMDWRTLRYASIYWRHLFDHYQLRDARVVLGYVSSIAVVLIVVGQMLYSGQGQEALSELLQGLPGVIPQLP